MSVKISMSFVEMVLTVLSLIIVNLDSDIDKRVLRIIW